MSFAPTAFSTQALFYQRLLNRMTYALRWYPVFNQGSPYSVSLHSNPAGSYRCPYPSPVDAQRLSRLWRSYPGFLPSAVLDRMAYALRKLLDIQPTVTVQCFTAF